MFSLLLDYLLIVEDKFNFAFFISSGKPWDVFFSTDIVELGRSQFI